MSVQMSVGKQINIAGLSFTQQSTITGTAALIIDTQGDVSLPIAQPGVQSATGAGTTAGTLTMTNSPHHITTAMIVDIYWTDPSTGVLFSLIGALVGTVSGQSVPITLGEYVGGGAALPVTNTPVVVCPAIKVNLSVIYTNMQGMAATVVIGTGTFVGNFRFTEATPTTEFQLQLAAGQAFEWDLPSGVANPLSATITEVWLSHNNIVSIPVLRVGVVTN